MPNAAAESADVVRVAVPSPLRQLFDYRLPALMRNGNPVGCRVQVPFGARQVTGVVIEVAASSAVPANKLKPVTALLDTDPVIPPDLMALCRWASRYYEHPVGDVASSALPVLLRQGEAAAPPRMSLWKATAAGMTAPASAVARAPKQEAALNALRAHPDGIPRRLIEALGLERAHLTALAKKGFAEEVQAHEAPAANRTGEQLLAEVPLTPSDDQAEVLAAIRSPGAGFRTFLIEGVTGSGKTEIYLQLTADALARGEQVLVLVPEIGLTPQIVDRFRRRFNRPVVALHSSLSDRERLDAWLEAISGKAAVVLGTRSAIFTPLKRPGLVIVDEEHDSSFKQQDGFRYHARDLAVLRARNLDIPVVLGSATPSLESLHNADSGKYVHLHLRQRAAAALPTMQVVDIRKQKLREGIGETLLDAVRKTLTRNEQVLLFLNRRGFAPVLVCHDCGWTADCRRCDARYTLHLEPRHLHCHHCGTQSPIPRNCSACGSTDLVPVGLGTERVEQVAREVLPPHTRVFRLDSDTARQKNTLPNLVTETRRDGPLVLIGTQMLAKGHHFPNVTLVGILDADSGLLSSDFRAIEKLAQILVQVSGRAGRAEKPGRVLIQTRQPAHPLLARLIHDGYDAWAKDALAERRSAELPPYSRLSLLRAESARETTAMHWLEAVRDSMASLPEGSRRNVLVMGPAPAPMARRGGRYRAQLLLQAGNQADMHAFLEHLLACIDADPESRRVRWSLDVDPVDLF